TAREAAARKAVADLRAARKEADDAVLAVAAKLRAAKLIGAQAQMQDILNAIDTILNERTALSRGTPNSIPTPAVEKPDPELAEKAFSAGLRSYYERQYAQAEEQLVTALKNSDQD